MHVPSGLFVQGHWTESDYNFAGHVANSYWGSTGGATKKDATHWLVQGGIAKNWFGIGNTALYGEYGKGRIGVRSRRWPQTTRQPGLHRPSLDVTNTDTGPSGVSALRRRSMRRRAQFYLGYRHFDADITCAGASYHEDMQWWWAAGGATKPCNGWPPRRWTLPFGRRRAVTVLKQSSPRIWARSSPWRARSVPTANG